MLEWQCEGQSTGWAMLLGSESGLVAKDEKGSTLGRWRWRWRWRMAYGVWFGVGVVAREAEAGKESQ